VSNIDRTTFTPWSTLAGGAIIAPAAVLSDLWRAVAGASE